MHHHLTPILITALVALAAAGEWPGRSDAVCDCGAFIVQDTGLTMIYRLPTLDVGLCNNTVICHGHCWQEFSDLTGMGDLNFIVNDGTQSVGQILCTSYNHTLNGEYVYTYSRLCKGPWEPTGDGHRSQQMLCCDAATNYYEC